MKVSLSPYIESINDNIYNVKLVESTLIQFIESFEMTPQNLQELSEDANLPKFISLITSYLTSNPIPNFNNHEVPAIILKILTFLCNIAIKHPNICDIIAKNTYPDFLIHSFFINNSQLDFGSSVPVEYFFLPLKYIAYISCSRHFRIEKSATIELLSITVLKILENPQLAAWAAAILSNISFHNEGFAASIRQGPYVKDIKKLLGDLLTSTDSCAIIAALASTVSLFPQNADFDLSVKAGIKILGENSPFLIAPHLFTDIVLKSIERIHLPFDPCFFVEQILEGNPICAYEMFRLLIKLQEKSIHCYDIQNLESLVLFLVDCNESFVSVLGCHYILGLLVYSYDTVSQLDQDHKILKKVLRKFLEMTTLSSVEKFETIVVILRLLLTTKPISREIINILQAQEENIFMQYMRRVQNNEAFASVNIFLLIYFISGVLPQWLVKLQKATLDSQFPSLVAFILTKSDNMKTVSDALLVTNLLSSNFQVKDESSIFFDEMTSGLVLINKRRQVEYDTMIDYFTQTRSKKDNIIQDSQRELQSALFTINRLNEELNDTKRMCSECKESKQIIEKNFNDLIKNFETLKNKYETERQTRKKLSSQAKELVDRNAKLEENFENLSYKTSRYDELKKEKALLIETKAEYIKNINDYEAELKVLRESLEKKKETIIELRNLIREKDDIITDSHGRCEKAQETLVNYEKVVQELKSENDRLNTQVSDYQQFLTDETRKCDGLQSALNMMKDELERLRSKETEFNDFKKNSTLMKDEILKKLRNLEREKAKWETAARFANKVCQVKALAVKDVYGEVYAE